MALPLFLSLQTIAVAVAIAIAIALSLVPPAAAAASYSSFILDGSLSQGPASLNLAHGHALYFPITAGQVLSWTFALTPSPSCGVLVCAAKASGLCSNLNVSAYVGPKYAGLGAGAASCEPTYSILTPCWTNFLVQAQTFHDSLCLLLVNTNQTAVQVAYDIEAVAGSQTTLPGNIFLFIPLCLGGGLVLIATVRSCILRKCARRTPTAIPLADPPYQEAQVQMSPQVTEVAALSPRHANAAGTEPWIEACIVEIELNETSKPATPA